jgi:putative redox protein
LGTVPHPSLGSGRGLSLTPHITMLDTTSVSVVADGRKELPMAKEVLTEVFFKGGMRFDGKSGRAGKPVAIDFTPEGQPIDGYSGLELLLTSLCGCSGQVTVGLLKRMGQDVKDLTVHARGEKREIHPTVPTSIELDFEFRGGRIEGSSVEKALALSEERYCPVWVMLKAGVPITAKFRLTAG